jgi:hypothetical protein
MERERLLESKAEVTVETSEAETTPAARLRQQLERSPSTRPVLPGKRMQRLPRVPVLIGLEPQSSGQAARPVAAAQIKGQNDEPVRMPRVHLNSAKLVEATQLRKPEALKVQTEAGAPPRVENRDIKAESLEALGRKNPLWAEILGRETTREPEEKPGRVLRAARKAGARHAEWSAARHSDGPAAKAVPEGEWFVDSPLPFREYQASRGKRVWRSLQDMARSRRFTQVMAATLVLFLVSTLDVPWRSWAGKHISSAKERLASSIGSLSRPIEERAAFFIAEDFQKGLASWNSGGNGSVDLDPNGLMRVKGLALHERTLQFVNYRLDFDAKIQSGALGWVVRAADHQNYYAYRLVQSRSRSAPSFHLERYSVMDGLKVASTAVSDIALPDHLAKPGIFNSISVRVRDNQITTMVNGWGVDFWRDSQHDRGGVGFLSQAGDSALINGMNISGNNDSWGLILYGTAETLRSIRDTISPPSAMMQPRPFSAPVAVLWQPIPQRRSGF